MKTIISMDIAQVFFEALEYPEFARPNFFINKQKASEWSKGVYLTALGEVYHNSISVLHMYFNARKRGNSDLKKIEDFKIKVNELVGGLEIDKQIDKQTLDELHYAIQYAWHFDKEPKSFSLYQILSFVETALLFIRKEFNEQTKKSTNIHFRPRTKTYFTYLIAQDAPFFDFPKFKNATRELLFTTRNLNKLEKLLVSFHKVASEIVKLWNEELYFIEQKTHADNDSPSSERVRVEFHSDTLKHSWWSDEKLFDNLPHSFYMNQDFASFAANIANLVNGEIIHGRETKIKIVKKDFLNDFIRGIQHLSMQNDNELSIKNVIEDRLLEAPFRDYFSNWFAAQNYNTNCESLRGNKHIDLKIEHISIGKKIIEFKGWWNNGKHQIIQQLSNYLTQFEGEGYIFIINHSGKDIINLYQKSISKKENGYVTNSWKVLRYKRTSFYYFQSKHLLETQTKLVYHFILDIHKPKRVH